MESGEARARACGWGSGGVGGRGWGGVNNKLDLRGNRCEDSSGSGRLEWRTLSSSFCLEEQRPYPALLFCRLSLYPRPSIGERPREGVGDCAVSL